MLDGIVKMLVRSVCFPILNIGKAETSIASIKQIHEFYILRYGQWLHYCNTSRVYFKLVYFVHYFSQLVQILPASFSEHFIRIVP